MHLPTLLYFGFYLLPVYAKACYPKCNKSLFQECPVSNGLSTCGYTILCGSEPSPGSVTFQVLKRNVANVQACVDACTSAGESCVTAVYAADSALGQACMLYRSITGFSPSSLYNSFDKIGTIPSTTTSTTTTSPSPTTTGSTTTTSPSSTTTGSTTTTPPSQPSSDPDLDLLTAELVQPRELVPKPRASRSQVDNQGNVQRFAGRIVKSNVKPAERKHKRSVTIRL